MRPLADIKRQRVQIGITQHELAKKASVSQSLIAKIESGRLDPGYSKASHIFDVLASLSEAGAPTARSIMTRKMISVAPTDTAPTIIALMRKNGISQVPVLDKGASVGLITEHELLDQIAAGKDISRLEASDIMTEAPPTIPADLPVNVLMDILRHSPLVIIKEKGTHIGVVSRTDLLKTVGK